MNAAKQDLTIIVLHSQISNYTTKLVHFHNETITANEMAHAGNIKLIK